MAKESLTKSTAKKKAASLKKKKSAAASTPKKKAPAKKTKKRSTAATPKKTTAAAKEKKATAATKAKKSTAATKTKKATAATKTKKAAATKTTKKSTKTTKTTPAVKKKTTPKKAAPKKRAPAKAAKKVSVKELLQKKFDTSPPATLYKPPSELIRSSTPTAPPFVDQGDPAEAERIKKLLFKKFTLAPQTAEAAPQAAAPEADAAPIQTTPVEPPPPAMEGIESDPMGKSLKYAAIGLLVVVLLILNASRSNTQRFYITPVGGAVEIWQGKFMPIGKEKILVLPGTKAPAEPKAEYTKKEAFLLAYTHYLDAADALLDAPGMPDFEGIKSRLNKALAYVVTKPQRAELTRRLSNIDTMVLLYKADVAAARNTPEAMEDALVYLKEAADTNTNPDRAKQIEFKITAIKEQLADLKANAPVPAPQPVGTQ